MRGKAHGVDVLAGLGRITPAYAGKSHCQIVAIFRIRDHPRLCGEKPPEAPAGCCPAWITPAYAGKSLGAGDANPDTGDHPRLCGEKRNPKCLTGWSTGSPPPMRGKDQQFRFPSGIHRITPAYAGKRYCLFVMFHPNKDHPRLCGEKLSIP